MRLTYMYTVHTILFKDFNLNFNNVSRPTVQYQKVQLLFEDFGLIQEAFTYDNNC